MPPAVSPLPGRPYQLTFYKPTIIWFQSTWITEVRFTGEVGETATVN